MPEVTVTVTTQQASNVTPTVQQGKTVQSQASDAVGIPAGGTTNQVLRKKSNTNYDVEWGAEGGAIWGGISGTLSNQSDLNTALSNKSDVGHTHDDRYYTESEIDTLLTNKSNWDTAYSQRGYVGTKDVDETDIADTKILQYNATSGKLQYATYPTSAVWGSITGTLSNQTDLQSALDGKSSTSHNHSGVYEPVISAGLTSQYWRGDKSWQTLNQAAVAGLTTSDSPTFANITDSGLTAGYVIFAGVTGLLSNDNAFVWDNTNKRLGLSVTNPAYKLDLLGQFQALMTTGVGFGVGYRSSSWIGGASGNPAMMLRNGTGNWCFIDMSGSTMEIMNGGDYDLIFGTNNTTRLTIKNDGKIGVNQPNPSHQFEVNGSFYSNFMHLADQASDPSEDDGMIWYRSDLAEFRVRLSGVTYRVNVSPI